MVEQCPDRKLVLHLVLLSNHLGKLVDHLVEVTGAADVGAARSRLLGGSLCRDDKAVEACYQLLDGLVVLVGEVALNHFSKCAPGIFVYKDVRGDGLVAQGVPVTSANHLDQFGGIREAAVDDHGSRFATVEVKPSRDSSVRDEDPTLRVLDVGPVPLEELVGPVHRVSV